MKKFLILFHLNSNVILYKIQLTVKYISSSISLKKGRNTSTLFRTIHQIIMRKRRNIRFQHQEQIFKRNYIFFEIHTKTQIFAYPASTPFLSILIF